MNLTKRKQCYADQCEDYKTTSIMSHTLKLFLKIIHTRIHNKLEQNINGFNFYVLTQRCVDVNKNVNTCFVDYDKAFEKLRLNKLI